MTFAQEIEQLVAMDDEVIISVAVGAKGWDFDGDTEPKLLTWSEARPILDYEYDAGFGTEECHAIIVWTHEYVYFVHEYDGSTHLQRVPRHPVAMAPCYY